MYGRDASERAVNLFEAEIARIDINIVPLRLSFRQIMHRHASSDSTLKSIFTIFFV